MILLISAFGAVPLILFFMSKYYFILLEKLHSKESASSKLQMFALWLVASLVVFLSAFIPIITIKKVVPGSDVKWGILPLVVSIVLIIIFQKDEIKRIGTLLNARK